MMMWESTGSWDTIYFVHRSCEITAQSIREFALNFYFLLFKYYGHIFSTIDEIYEKANKDQKSLDDHRLFAGILRNASLKAKPNGKYRVSFRIAVDCH